MSPRPSDPKFVPPVSQDPHLLEKRRRRREMIFAALAFLLVLILTSVQLNQFRTGDALFVVMFNVNFVLLLGILLVVLRNGVKLLLERRRRVLGSRLRTRLVLAFVGLSLLPCLLMFLVTTKYVQLSMDFWFKDQVENSMDSALDVARSMYDRTGERLGAQGAAMLAEVTERKLAWGGNAMDALLERKRREYRIVLTALKTPDGKLRAGQSSPEAVDAWEAAENIINWDEIRRQGSAYALVPTNGEDYVFTVLAVDKGRSGHLILAEDLGTDFKERIDRITRGSREYKHLREIKQPLKLMLYSSLGVLTALIILGAIWFGFRVARELSSPIFALAAATDRISGGDLTVRVPDNVQDEMGMLMRSFNRMATDLEESRLKITGANTMLEEQNQRIARHSKYIETVLNNIGAGVVSFDSSGYINTVNRAACEIIGKDPEALIGRRVEDFMPEPHATFARDIRNRFRQRMASRVQNHITLNINGEERRLLVNVVGFSTEGAYSGSVAVFEDISELERMQRMAAWREVARRIAHEIKNPLTPIKLSAQRLARKFGDLVNDPAFIQSTSLIVRQVEHLQNMVQEFSSFAKLPEVSPQPGRLEPLLESITELFRNSHSAIRWDLDIPIPLPELPMDQEALHRAFLNIMTNAAEALQIAGTPAPQVRITAMCNPRLNHVRVDVADNGPGLSEEERSRLFEPYFTHKKGGTGLGLTIVRSIITDHHGYVRALPREDGGTILVLELPLA